MTEQPFHQAHPRHVPDRPPADSWQRDVSLVLGAIAFLLIVATVAVLLNPVTVS